MSRPTRSLRAVIASYVLIGAVAVLLPPLIPITDPSRVVYWVGGAVLCLFLLASTWRRSPLPRPVSVGVGWLVLLLSLHLSFVVDDLLAMLLGLPLSVAVLSLAAGQVTPRTRQALLTLHVAMSGIWLGIAVVMVTLTVLAAGTDDVGLAHSHYALLERFDVTILPWSSLASIMSGLAVSLTGKWGLVKHYWVLTKFVLAVLVLASAFAFLHDWVVTAAESSRLAAVGSGAGVEPDPAWLVAGFGYAGLLVLAATVLSVYKPWGRTWFGRRDTRNRAAGRRGVPVVTASGTAR